MKATHTHLKVYPISWDKKIAANLKKDWEIRYTYFSNEFPQGKIIRFKGMNHCKTLQEKQDQTRSLIEKELISLSKGFNPITRQYEIIDENIVSETTPFYRALEISLKSFTGVDSTLTDYENTMKHLSKYSDKINIKHKEIKNITKGDIKQLLMSMSLDGHSNYRVNKTRSHLSKFFSHFTELDIFLVNFIEGISKLPHDSAKKNIIRTNSEWKKFHSIKDLNYNVYVFLYIFLYSGCRFEEMVKVKKEDVELDKSIFWIQLKKGGKHTRAMRPINIQVWSFWKHLCDLATTNQYLFSYHQLPNDNPIKANSMIDISTRYLKLAGLNMTGYGLKTTFLNLVAKEYGITKAKELAGHTNEKTTKIYALDYEEHLVQQNKNIKININ